jgi:hypothetical protein
MKQCPACKRIYTDDALSFCLEDGTQLQSVGTSESGPSSFDQNYDPNKTLAYSQPRETSPPPTNLHPAAPMNQAPMAQGAWSPTPSYSPMPAMQPARKSGKGWIIGAIAGVIALGIGIVVLLMIIGKDSSTANKNANASSNRAVVINKNSNSVVVNANNTNNTNNTNRDTTTTHASFLKDDFSTENWPTGESAYGSFYQDGEYHMKGKPSLYIFMFPRNSANYTTEDANVKVTTRNVDGKSPEYGYGLIIHGKVNQQTQLEGYGFLIYTGQMPKYEIVRFVAGEATPLVKWESSPVIRGGTNSNQIEVRTQGSKLSLYINGQFVKSITDTAGMTEGFVGLYTSETNEVAFDDMEIDRNAE